MKITFELSDADLRFFRGKLARAGERRRDGGEAAIRSAVRHLLGQMQQAAVPGFVRERASKVELMVRMLEDEEWRLSGADREHVSRVLAYFAEPEDLVTDCIPGLGFLDDAIMVELAVEELRHELEAYRDFCRYRDGRGRRPGATLDRREWLELRRRELQGRMRRRSRRERRSRSARIGRSPFSLW